MAGNWKATSGGNATSSSQGAMWSVIFSPTHWEEHVWFCETRGKWKVANSHPQWLQPPAKSLMPWLEWFKTLQSRVICTNVMMNLLRLSSVQPQLPWGFSQTPTSKKSFPGLPSLYQVCRKPSTTTTPWTPPTSCIRIQAARQFFQPNPITWLNRLGRIDIIQNFSISIKTFSSILNSLNYNPVGNWMPNLI
jgi:hypothetical protein